VFLLGLPPMASFRVRGGRVRGDLDDLGGAGAGGQTPGGRRLASSNTSATTPTWLRGRIMRLTGSPGKYSDPAYTDLSFRVPSSLDYRLNQPRRRRRSHAASPGTRYTGPPPNRRRHGEQLPARGPRPGGAQERQKHPGLRPVRRRPCVTDDRSGVSFGSFREDILAATCTLSGERPGYNEIRVSDVNINIKILTWTVNPNSKSCSERWDLESVMTHE
jgi:hypothetical protein